MARMLAGLAALAMVLGTAGLAAAQDKPAAAAPAAGGTPKATK